ncbi:MAG: hypothetical protein CSB33_01755 [Desulfobacterales bacterium]|nr:MAG: hypothetical protein CSB33_01755 [Desulfobacterales bacterium]
MTILSPPHFPKKIIRHVRRLAPVLAAAILFVPVFPASVTRPPLPARRVAGPFSISPLPPADPFPVPRGMHSMVNFWIRIFTEFSTHEVILHDEYYLGLIYGVVDLSKSGAFPWKAVSQEKNRIISLLEEAGRGWDAPETLSPGARQLRRRLRDLDEDRRFPPRKAAERVHAQLGQRESIRKAVQWSGQYLPLIHAVLDGMRMPRDIAVLPLVESAFNPFASSPDGAAGLWQLMPAAARQRGLSIGTLVDERRDPLLATGAAARHLLHNHSVLGSWPLAVTAYNTGLQRTVTAVKTVGSRDLGELIREFDHHRFDYASRNFYAEFLAARIIFARRERFFPDLVPDPAPVATYFRLPRPTAYKDLARYAGLRIRDVRHLNPALLPESYAPDQFLPAGYPLRIQRLWKDRLGNALDVLAGEKKWVVKKSGYFHRIKPGETLSCIARRYQVSVADLLEINGLTDAARIRAGLRIEIPESGAVGGGGRTRAAHDAPPPLPEG